MSSPVLRPEVVTRPTLAPHRGGTILVLGILGICVVFVCGIIAWVLGRADLKAMEAGTMDRSGEGMTRAGVICGMIGTAIGVLGVILVAWMISTLGTVAHSFPMPPR